MPCHTGLFTPGRHAARVSLVRARFIVQKYLRYAEGITAMAQISELFYVVIAARCVAGGRWGRRVGAEVEGRVQCRAVAVPSSLPPVPCPTPVQRGRGRQRVQAEENQVGTGSVCFYRLRRWRARVAYKQR